MARVPSTKEEVAVTSLALNVEKVGLSQDQFFRLCSANPEFAMELSAQKELFIMTLPGPETSRRNAIITTELTNWARKDGAGITFDCACLFVLPNGAIRAPDASWLRRDRWDALTPEQKRQAAPLCPDFVVELLSPSDRLRRIQAKMEEFIANGAQLGWLIDPDNRTAYIYRPGAPVETLEDPAALSGDPVLPGFVFDVTQIW